MVHRLFWHLVIVSTFLTNPISTANKKNELVFERLVCTAGKSTKVQVKNCFMRRAGRIGTDRINATLHFVILEPLVELDYHVLIFFKYQAYRRLPIDISDNVCNLFKGKKRSSFLDMTMGRALKFLQYDHKLECPLLGDFAIQMTNVSLNEEFPAVPLLPSGQYRVSIVLAEGHRKTVFLRAHFYLAISDRRLEQYDNFDDLKKFENKTSS